MASIWATLKTKTILYWLAILIFFGLFIGFLVAYIKAKNANFTPTEPPPTVEPLPSAEEIRLSDKVWPTHYSLHVLSDHQNNLFNGTVTIDLSLQTDQSQIKLNCKNLKILNFSLTYNDSIAKVSQEVGIKQLVADDRLETCIFKLAKSTPKGEYQLSLVFSGQFKSGQITGFYKSSYTTVDNQVRYLTATKFEPTYARMAFPCFDEPIFKAPFDIAITHPSSLIALSNEAELDTVPVVDGWSKTRFRQTSPMSTYLVAFVVSDFKYTETRTTFGTRVRVYSRPDQVNKTRYATDTAAEILRYYENYTGIPYALSKLDLIGLPEFVSGAMENWGLVTYKETYVLYSEIDSSLSDMRQIAKVIAHELAHMWFGNLVSLKWWNDIWLNEGFATFIEYKGQNYVNKTWTMFERFTTASLQSAMLADKLQSSRPLVGDVLTSDQVTAMFETITYDKGASILNMVEEIIGETAFQSCARAYLSQNKNGNVATSDFVNFFKNEIQKVTQIDGAIFLDKWLYNNSFPIINVTRSKTDNYSLDLSQSAYNTDASATLDKPWNIYVEYILFNSQQGSFVLNQTKQTVKLEYEITPNQWFKLNRGSKGYYIVNYQLQDWQLLIKQLIQKPTALSNVDRANILFDAQQLSEKTLLSQETLFDLLDYLKNENDYLPWLVASSTINSLQSKLIASNSFSLVQYNAYIRQLISNIYDEKVDFSADLSQLSFNQMSLQNSLISLACRYEYEQCLTQTSALFRKWIDNRVVVDPNIRLYVYKYGLKFSTDDNDWNRVWDLYQSEKDALEKSKLMSALTSTTSTTLLLTLISYSTNQSIINNENFFSVQQNIASNSEIGRSMVWDYIQNNWDALVERFTLNDRRLGNYVRSVTSGFGTESRLNEMKNFFARYPNAGAGAAARQSALEAVQKNIQWEKDNGPEISLSLKSRDQYANPWLTWRLDEFVRPTQYNINLNIDVDQERFSGSVSIEVNVSRSIRYLILHSKELTITNSNVTTKADKTLVSLNNQGFAYELNQFWVIPMAQIVAPGTYIAQLTFNGKLSTTLSGLYLSSYNSSTTGEKVKLATTQFEAGYARKAFPCFDEPQFKANFTIAITHNVKYSAISNMPVDYILSSNEQRTTFFQQSVKMSTYLVAFIVSDFVSKKSSYSDQFSVYTYNSDVNLPKVDYALDVGPRILEYYADQYFQIKYPLPKMDMVSIPDFSMGAMENWGLVTYRDVSLLYDSKETSSASKMDICSTIAHELAHMWYGDLVTIKWWDDLWLNEGFAQFMMYKATAAVEPSWQYNQHIVINELIRVFDIDSALNTRAILTPVRDENAMQSIFDGITYAKGASIIRMLEDTLGEENFRTAVKNYLNKHAYGNTVTNDLWSEFSKVLPPDQLDVTQMMDPWVRKEGFPVVTVTVKQDGQVTFTQEQFLKDFDKSNSTTIWTIPLTYRLIDPDDPILTFPSERVIINQKVHTHQLSNYESNYLIKMNLDQTGVYIVNYPTSQWNIYANQLSNSSDSIIWKKLSALDRNSLLSDAFYLSRSGRLDYTITLKLAQFLRYERNYIVWSTGSSLLSYIRTFAITQDGGTAYNYWLLNIVNISAIYDELGWDSNIDENLNQKRLRALILDLTCQADHEKCLNTADQKFNEYMASVSAKEKKPYMLKDYSPDPDTFTVFLYHSMRRIKNDNRSKFDFLLAQYKNASSTNDKMRLLRALTAVQSPTLLNELISSSLNTDFLRSQDFFSFLLYLSYNPIGIDLAWKFYQDNFQTIQDRYGLDDSNVGRAIYRFAVYFTTETKRQEVVDLYAKYPISGASELYRQQALELIDANIQWTKKYYNTVISFVTNYCQTCPWKNYRLSDYVRPQEYDLLIQVDTNSYLYNGTMKAIVSITTPVNYIILHAASILKPSNPRVSPVEIRNATIRKQKLLLDTDYSTGKGFQYAPLEFYVIPLVKKIESMGNYTIEVDFEGNLLLGGTVGLYHGWYPNDDGTTVNIAATQFESTNARKVFPFFDEPHFKQPVTMTIIHDKVMNTTLSNMPINNEITLKSNTSLVETKYQKSVKMPTYLIAILVSDFQCSAINVTDSGSDSVLAIRTCASKVHDLDKHTYSLDATPKIIKHYENTFNYRYQLSKLDQIALPQFSPGAMENWGLVKYREKMLLWWEQEDTSSEQRSVVAVIAHELAHMWFGNLVTCDFWGELWLNEAFASYMEYAAVSAVHPDWNYFDMLAYYDQFNAILGDSTESSQPIVRTIPSPAQMGYSSNIVYNKGSSILNMFNFTMGKENFVTSLQEYLKKREYQTAVTKDLFDSFAKHWTHTGQSIDSFMNSWTYNPGFPYLNITFNDQTKQYTYRQQRFLQSGAKPAKEYTYVIPFAYYQTDPNNNNQLKASAIQFISEKEGTISLENFIKANTGFNSFYLVNYPDSHWEKLANMLLQNENDFINALMVNDRADLLISSFLLARAKLVSYLTPFNLYNYLVNEKHFVPWYFYDYSLNYLALRMDRTEYRSSLLQFERRLTAAHYTGLNFWDATKGTNLDKSFRSLLIRITCRSGNADCLLHAHQKFVDWKQNGAQLAPDLRSNIVNYGISYSKEPSDYEFVWQKFITEKSDSPLKTVYLQGLSFITDSKIMFSYLDMALNETLVSKDNFVTFFNYIITNVAHEATAWNYFVENYSMLSRKLSTNQMDSIMQKFASFAVTSARKSELNSLFTKYENMGVSNNARVNVLQTVDSNIAWMGTHKTEVGEWFTKNACGNITPQICPWGELRINKTTSSPTKYDLVIQVNVTTYVYNGTVDIAVTTYADLEFITLNAADILNTSLVSVTGPEGNSIDSKMFRYKPQGYVVVQFAKSQSAGEYVLHFAFNGNLLDGGLSGLYLSKYTELNGTSYGLASTQFEFYDARKVFPCFDEPAFKSIFNISIIHDSKMNATLSNMAINDTISVPGKSNWLQTNYKSSPPMTTYLVAMLVSDFVCDYDNNSSSPVRYGVCASRTQQHKMDYALEWAPKSLQALEDLLGVKYPLEKVELLAIPDFYYGAMENWGLVTFRETALLFSESDTTSASKMSITSTITHELAHFWFGNLVTCEWWDSLFLNEAFATLMEFKIVDTLEPKWNYEETFLMGDYEPAINTDSMDSAHPIIRKITSTQQIDQFNSNIIYAKGSSFLRMVRYVMGSDNFYDALRTYLDTYKYKNTRAENLLNEFDKKFSTPIDGVIKITDFAQEWLNEKGFPYVNVTKQSNGYSFTQQRFMLTPSVNISQTIWKIPLSFYTDSNWTLTDSKIHMLTQKTMSFNDLPTNELIKLNAGHYGFYLVNYPIEMWTNWTDALVNRYEQTKLPPVDRAGLLLDAFYLARSNLIPYTVPLKLIQYLPKEKHITPWNIAIRGLNFISKYVILGSTYGTQFQKNISNLVSPIYNELGWNDTIEENVVTRRLRATILDFACDNQLSDCISQSSTLFKQWKESKTNNSNQAYIPTPNLLSPILKYGLKSNPDDWLFVWSLYLQETSATLKSIYLTALANTPDQSSINMLLTQAMETKTIRSQDAYSVFSLVAGSKNQQSLETVWQFYKSNYKRLVSAGSPLRLTQMSTLLNTICSNHFFTKERKNELISFFAQNPIGLSSTQQAAALSTIDANINWIQNRMIEVENFLLCGEQSCPFTIYRLSQNVNPDRYDLQLTVDLDNDRFEGSVTITVNLAQGEEFRYFTLYAASTLNITSSTITNANNEEAIEVEDSFFYRPYEYWVLKLANAVKGDQVKLKFEFNSALATDMYGIYRSEYFDPKQKRNIKLVSTQFQDTYARRAFPCFDEPTFKSVFHVTLTYNSKYNATMSNTVVADIRQDRFGRKITEFSDTPRMVTYLLAFVISDFHCGRDSTTIHEKVVSVCASPPQAEMTNYSLNVAPRIIQAMQTRFNYAYQLDKMDIVAIPDFSAGAMENWGLLTFRETSLLWDKSISSISDKMRVASVVAHEIAHMWFGNMVTCRWWSDLWLNEAFASYFEWFSVNEIEPSWNYLQLFYTTDYIAGLNADASSTAHPLVRVVNTPSDIPYISNIIYQKGSSVLRMFEFVFTTNKFFTALDQYLKDNQYTSVASSVLLNALAHIQVEGLNSSAFVNSWTLQAGFPYLNLTRSSEGTNTFIVNQERFLANGQTVNSNQTWVIPLSYYIDYQIDQKHQIEFLSSKSQNISVNVNSNILPIKFNIDSQGFYIVNYPTDEWQKWINLFNDEKLISSINLTPQDYANLIYDAFTLSGAGLLPYNTALELTALLKYSEQFPVWSTGSTVIGQLWPYFRTNDTIGPDGFKQDTFRLYAQTLATKAYDKYGLQAQNVTEVTFARLRQEVSAFACAYKLDRCLLEAQVEYQKWRSGSQLSGDVRSIVLRYAIQESTDDSDWHYLWNEYTNAWKTTLKLDYLQGMAQTSNRTLLTLLFDRANNQTLVRRQDYLSLYSYAIRTQTGYEVAWQYFTTNYKIIKQSRLDNGQIGTLANYFARYINNVAQRTQFEGFFVDHPDTGISVTNLNKALETIDKNIKWSNSYRQSVYNWLRDHRPNDSNNNNKNKKPRSI